MNQQQAKPRNVVERQHRISQNYLIIWVDGNIDLTKEDYQNSMQKLQSGVSKVKICKKSDECIQMLNEIDEDKAFVISSGTLGQNLVRDIHSLRKVNAIYIFCSNVALHKQWADKWSKIRGVFDSIEPICESLKRVARECDQDDTPMSFISKEMTTSVRGNHEQDLDLLPPSYMYSMIFKDIILEIKDDHGKQMQNFVNYCLEIGIPEKDLEDFPNQYHEKVSVRWYTREMFLYGMLNRALRSLDIECMTKMGFFIRHLHCQLKELHRNQLQNFKKEFVVYRGQRLSKDDFEKLSTAKGGLLSFDNFLSTSKKLDVAMDFAQTVTENNNDTIGVLFTMTIDPKKMSTATTPFALIEKHSDQPGEEEILFTMHTVFRVIEVKKPAQNNRLWEVQLAITDDSDPALIDLTNQLKKDIDGSGWFRMGKLMFKLSLFDQAEVLYNELLKDATVDNDRQHIYHMLGMIKDSKGEYETAVECYKESLKIELKTVPENATSLAPTYANIAAVYDNMGNYSEALEFYQKANQLFEKSLSSNDPDLATSYNNIGLVYNNMEDYPEALKFHKKSLEIRKKVLSQNHPDVASSYDSIGLVYNNMDNYSEALKFYNDSLKIRERTLPKDHLDFAQSYNNIGAAHYREGDYSKALQFLEKALNIRKKSLPSGHPLIKDTMNNIECVKKKKKT